MPPKGQPRPKPPSRRGECARQENDTEQALSAPSQKALVEDVGELQDVPMSTEPANSPYMPPSNSGSTENPPLAPTATASSPPPPRRPRQRLASVLPRSSSNTPSLANPDGEARPAALKFKPKNFARKSKEEREAAEKAEAERLAARYVAESRSNAGEGGGYHARGRGGAGFGDMSRGKDQRFNLSHSATGHLGGSTLGEVRGGRRGRGGYGGGGGGGGGSGGGGGGSGGGGGGGGGGAGGGGGGGERGGHSGASDSTSTRVKKEPTLRGEKDKDGDVVMGSSMPKSKPKRTKIKKEDQGPTYVSSDGEFDSDGNERMDIERINLVTEDEASGDELSEIAKGKQRERPLQLRLNHLKPVRIQRQEHVERAVGVNTDASSLTSAELRRKANERNEAGGSLFLPEEDEAQMLNAQKGKGRRKPKDVEFVKDERKWKGVYQDEDDKDSFVKIKDEPKDEGDVMLVDEPLEQEGPERMAVDEDEAIPLSGAIQNTLPDISGAIPQQPLDIDQTARDIAEIEKSNQTPQDENLQQPDEERARAGHYSDTGLPRTHEKLEAAKAELSAETDEMVLILDEIDSKAPTSEPMPAIKPDEPDNPVDQSHEANALVPLIEGANYTFQLPPLLPSLRDTTKKPAPPEKAPKPKPTTPAHEPPKPSTSTNNPFATPIKEDPDIKPDPDAFAPVPSIPHTYISGGIYHPSGHLGSFRIHKGGKISASWGGLGMEVARSGEGNVDTPQELVMTEFESEVVKKEDENAGGVWEERVSVGVKGWGVGMTRPGFVAVPGLGGLLA